MDIPYSSSGASSAAHYALVRAVERAKTVHDAEQLLAQEVERIRRRFASKVPSTSELRKELVVLLYCLNTSMGDVTSEKLGFALPVAVHLAEAGTKVNEKFIGYLFCAEVMPRDHELQLMLVNTIRKDLHSSSVSLIDLALNALIASPSENVIPAVQTQLYNLVAHPSSRIKAIALSTLRVLSATSPDILRAPELSRALVWRFEDGDLSVVSAALRFGVFMVKLGIMAKKAVLSPTASLVRLFTDRRQTRNYPSAFQVRTLQVLHELLSNDQDVAESVDPTTLCQCLLRILRRAVKADYQPLIFDVFRLLGILPPSVVGEVLSGSTQQGPAHTAEETYLTARALPPSATLDKTSAKPEGSTIKHSQEHPVAQIRHILSSRTLNEHFLFLSCIACLDPSLWAGQSQSEVNANVPSIPFVLDQMEVERVLSFLESEDDVIRGLTIRIIASLNHGLAVSCYNHALSTLRSVVVPAAVMKQKSRPPSSASRYSDNGVGRNGRGRVRAIQLTLELAAACSLGGMQRQVKPTGDEQGFAKRLRAVTELVSRSRADGIDGSVVETALRVIRKLPKPAQVSCMLDLFSVIEADAAAELSDDLVNLLDETFVVILLSSTCERASLLSPYGDDVRRMVQLLSSLLGSQTSSVQELILLCIIRLNTLLPPGAIGDSVGSVRKTMHDASSKDCQSVVKRCAQFLRFYDSPEVLHELLSVKSDISLPELAFLLDQSSPLSDVPSPKPLISDPLPSSPPRKLTSLHPSSRSVLSSPPPLQGRLRYTAYAPPPPVSITRFGRNSNRSGSSVSSRRSSVTSETGRLSRERGREPVGAMQQDMDLARTVTAGELAVVGIEETESYFVKHPEKGRHRKPGTAHIAESAEKVTKSDISLIALDSPFLSEPLVDATSSITPPGPSPYVSANASLRATPEPDSYQNFEVIWSDLARDVTSFSSRGWCEDAVEDVVRRLQAMGERMDVIASDVPPFEGDLKIMLRQALTLAGAVGGPLALLRLHEEDDGSCLWQMKSDDQGLGLRLKDIIR